MINLLVLALIVTVAGIAAYLAYRNGIRDGYQNTFLPHVIRQVIDEGLKQGGRIDYQ